MFTEGTILKHRSGVGRAREEIVKQVQNHESSVRDYDTYVPIGNAVEQLTAWQKQGADLFYLTSRRTPTEIHAIQNVLLRYHFPHGNLEFRKEGESYSDVAERLLPDVIIEDDCESIGGESEMTYPKIRNDIKDNIKSVVVKEFGGIDNLPEKFSEL